MRSGIGSMMKVVAVVMLAALSGCRWGGHHGNPPAAFTYADQVLTTGVAMTPVNPAPAVSGTGITYSVATGTTLPAGLSIDATTGAISGTPTVVSPATNYAINAKNSRGTTASSIRITVNPPAPVAFTYAPQVLTVNTAMAAASPTPAASGTGTTYAAAASTPLPAGLVINGGTGVITGTPTAVSTATSYTINATNAGGTTASSISITVNPLPPAAFSYPAQTLTANTAMAPASPAPSSPGATYAVASNTPLPSGLVINTSTGVISGTPTTTSTGNYTITATNAGGSTPSSISITVNAATFGVVANGGAGNGQHTRAYGVSTNASGNVYVAGDTDEALSGTTPLGAIDLFLSKFSAAGSHVYTKRIGAVNIAGAGWSTASDASDNVYVTGLTNCAWPACSSTADTQNLSVTAASDLVLNKYDNVGNLLWARQLGATLNGVAAVNTSHFVLADTSAVYMTGHTGGDLYNAHTGTWDLFLAKYDAVSGTKIWGVQLGVASAVTDSWSIAKDSAGNLFVTGSTNGNFGGTKTGGQDMQFSKFDASGALQYTQLLGASGSSAAGFGVASDGSPTGKVYVAGFTCGGLDGNTLSRTGACDMFLTQYGAATGNRIGTTQMGSGAGSTIARSVAVDSAGNVYVTGYTPGPVFDGQTVTGTNDMFLMKFDPNGVKQFTKVFGTASQSTQAYSVTTDASGNVFVAGYVVIGGATSATNTKHYFLRKFNSSGVPQ